MKNWLLSAAFLGASLMPQGSGPEKSLADKVIDQPDGFKVESRTYTKAFSQTFNKGKKNDYQNSWKTKRMTYLYVTDNNRNGIFDYNVDELKVVGYDNVVVRRAGSAPTRWRENIYEYTYSSAGDLEIEWKSEEQKSSAEQKEFIRDNLEDISRKL